MAFQIKFIQTTFSGTLSSDDFLQTSIFSISFFFFQAIPYQATFLTFIYCLFQSFEFRFFRSFSLDNFLQIALFSSGFLDNSSTNIFRFLLDHIYQTTFRTSFFSRPLTVHSLSLINQRILLRQLCYDSPLCIRRFCNYFPLNQERFW